MLQRYFRQFLDYCRLADFSIRSIQALTARLHEFEALLNFLKIRSVKKIEYRHLINFVADYKEPSIHVRKPRVWTLRQFYHFLTLHRHIPKNIAVKLPYPKIEKTVPLENGKFVLNMLGTFTCQEIQNHACSFEECFSLILCTFCTNVRPVTVPPVIMTYGLFLVINLL